MIAALTLGATLSLAPVTLTYPELAAALTKAGMPTESSTSLRSRAAYVSLRDRTPEAARHLLGEALGIAFEPLKGGGWQMVADPAVKERDRRFLAAYRRVVAARFRSIASEAARVSKGTPYRVFLADVKRRAADPLRTVEGLAETKRAMILVQPAVWNGVAALVAPEALAALSGRRSRRFPFAALGLPASVYGRPTFQGGELVLTPHDVARGAHVDQSFSFDPRLGLVLVATTVREGVVDNPGSVPLTVGTGSGRFNVGLGGTGYFTFWAEPGGVAETFRAMGEEAEAYFAGLRPSLPPPFPIPGTPVWAVSAGLERIGVATEAAMELSPRFDSFSVERYRSERPRASLRALFVPLAAYSSTVWDGLQTLSMGGRSVLEQEGRAWPWHPVLRDGVLLALNPYAFLDRAQPVAAAPYVRLRRVIEEIRPANGEPAPSWAMARRMAAAARPETTLAEMDPTYMNPRGIDYSDLAKVIDALDPLPETSRPAFWAALRRDGTVRLPLHDGSVLVRAGSGGGTLFAVGYMRYDAEGSPVEGAEALIDGRGTLLP